jgi:type II secretory pathway component PulF
MVAANEAALRKSLAEQRLRLVSFRILDDVVKEKRPRRLSRQEAAELVHQISALARVDDPLAAGLIAAAEEAESRRVARVMQMMPAHIARGSTLEEAITTVGQSLPPEV